MRECNLHSVHHFTVDTFDSIRVCAPTLDLSYANAGWLCWRLQCCAVRLGYEQHQMLHQQASTTPDAWCAHWKACK